MMGVFLLTIASRPGVHPASYKMHAEIMLTKREADHSHPPSAKVKNGVLYLHSN
jgi:hypothetical protein